MPAPIIIETPKKVLIVGMLSNNIKPIIIDQIIREYSYKETTDGDAMLYALNIQKNAKAPINPINIIIGQA